MSVSPCLQAAALRLEKRGDGVVLMAHRVGQRRAAVAVLHGQVRARCHHHVVAAQLEFESKTESGSTYSSFKC